MQSRTILLAICVLCFSLAVQSQSEDEPFYFGVDLSYVNEMDDCGAVYRENGQARDAYELFAERGANLVRARLWHNPDWTEYSTLDDVKRTFQRAQDAGMSTLLDFHYSDNWADPGKQEVPRAWADITDTNDLAEALYEYTYNTLIDLHNTQLTPDFVQVGNETNSGLVKDVIGLNWERDAQLFNAGIRAIRDFAVHTDTDTQIILHVAQPQNTGWWFTEAEKAGVTDFDVIGISYYPQWSPFSIGDMGAQVNFLRQRFGKKVMVLETAYGWTREAVDESADNVLNQGIRGYAFSPEDQLRYMLDLTQSLISNGASGVVYWEPAWVSTDCMTRWGQGSHWENATFFDFNNDNEVLDGINFLNFPYSYPSQFLDGVLGAEYGEAPVIDGVGDVLEGIAEIDLLDLSVLADETSYLLGLRVAGDVYAELGNYLIYFDTTHDENGADVDVLRRPITVADPHKPEYRLDIQIRNERGTNVAGYTLQRWTGEEWEEGTFTGGASITSGEPSTIELQIPRQLLGDPETVYIGIVSTNRGRVSTAGDILGSDVVPADWDEALILDSFFPLES